MKQATEFVSARAPMQWSPVGGRVVGRININTVWDRQIMWALADPQQSNFFYDPAAMGSNQIDKMFDKMLITRSPNVVPGPTDRPFLGKMFVETKPGWRTLAVTPVPSSLLASS